MTDHVRFPSIEQFRTAIRNVQHKARFTGRDETGEPTFDQNIKPPVVQYLGTVKLHGTNAAINYDFGENAISYQSRERVLSLGRDNQCFMLHMSQFEDLLWEMLECLELHSSEYDQGVVVFGEWCGQGIAKKVAVCELPKMFVVFGIRVGHRWVDMQSEQFRGFKDEESRIFNIMDFPTWTLPIDFDNPGLIQNTLVDLTMKVEEECPVAKAFGVSGIGEGIVWRPLDSWKYGSDCWFKVKGEKHSASKVKTLAAVDVEAVRSQTEFLENVVTEERLEQGVSWLVNEAMKPLDMTSMGDFIRWIFDDIIKEESDTIVASQIDPKKIGGPVANKARPWFINRMNKEIKIS